MAVFAQKHKKLPRLAGTCGYFLLFRGQHNGRVPHSRLLKVVAGARDSFTYQITDMPLLSTFYEPLSQQLISVLGIHGLFVDTASRYACPRAEVGQAKRSGDMVDPSGSQDRLSRV